VIFKLDNKIQNYAWGSHDFIATLLNQQISTEPQAELWMGTHPKGESCVIYENHKITLTELISKNPSHYLGKNICQKFGNNLPFLYKILAAEKPLSIQVHPNLEQAKSGFAKEDRANIKLTDFMRNYKDANHKPELLCALTEFDAMCGFKPFDEIKEILNFLNISQHFSLATLPSFFENLLKIKTNKEKLIKEVITQISKAKPRSKNEEFSFAWTQQLAKYYPQDLGTLAPLYLNIFRLKPGEAIYLKAGILHSYLKGAGIEIMANSDNVLRGGLTPKHIDINELLRVVNYDDERVEILKPKKNICENIYRTDAAEFQLSQIVLHGKLTLNQQNPTIILCTEGFAKITNEFTLKKGEAAFVPFEEKEILLNGKGVFYRATVADKIKIS
jgi:mannose-6-phosphate isomerase